MISKLFRGLALSAALTGTALAGPALRPEVTVVAAIVTVGDMFEDAGLLAEEALFRAPAPGTTGIVEVEAVRKAASLVGLGEFDASGVVRVRVARAATPVDETMLTDLIVADLANRGIVAPDVTAIAAFEQPNPAFNAEAVERPVSLSSLTYLPASGGFKARFLIAGHDAPVDLAGRIDLMVEVPHLAETLPAGTVLSPSHFEMRLVPLKTAETAGFARLEDLAGKALQRQSRAGIMLRLSDVAEPELVSRSDLVTIYFRKGALTLTVRGQALGGASRGQPVQVLNLMSRRVVTAVALAPGAVEIVGPANVAGL